MKNENGEVPNIGIKSGLHYDSNKRVYLIDRLEKISHSVNRFFAWLAGISLVLMIVMVVGNTVTRAMYVPITGSGEIIGWLGAVTIAFALGYTQIEKGHVLIDMIVQKFPKILQRLVDILVAFICTLFFVMVSWQLIRYGINSMQSGQLSQTLQIVFYPFIFIVSAGFMGLTLVLFTEFMKSLTGRNGG